MDGEGPVRERGSENSSRRNSNGIKCAFAGAKQTAQARLDDFAEQAPVDVDRGDRPDLARASRVVADPSTAAERSSPADQPAADASFPTNHRDPIRLHL